MRKRFVPAVLGVVAVVVGLMVAGSGTAAPEPSTVDVQILAVNDFHGNLEPIPSTSSSGRIGSTPAGGVEYLATHIASLRAANPNTAVVSAGDMIGASPLLSALFHDEPTIEAFNAIGIDFNAVGNHEFDEGVTELLRMQEGGCHPVDGCLDGDDFAGAEFQFLAANVVYKSNGKPIFPAYKTKTFKGAKIGFVGMTLEGTPSIVTPSGIASVDFLDEADTVNALVPKMKQQGIETIVVVIHEGGLPATGTPADGNACPGISGAIVDIVDRLDDEVDLVISGHTHQAYNCVIDGRRVTSAASFGRLVTKIDLTVDRYTGEVVGSPTADNRIVTRDVAKDAAQTALIADYNTIAAPLANRVIGSITANITRTGNAAGESALGDVIADGQLDATSSPATGSAVVAFMNPGGIRADLSFAPSGAEAPGDVTYGEMFAVQPFGNNLVTMTLTGAQIDTLLEQQFDNPGAGQSRILQVSRGFTYTWDQSEPTGSKVSNIMLNGVPVAPGTSYRVTVNSFLADGGDRFFILPSGTNRLGGAVDTDAFEAYFAANSPVPPGPQNRITVVP
jgi:5'-nucleotidase